MKICLISNLYPPNVLGGAEIIVEKMALGMKKLDHEVIVITTSPDKDEHILYRNDVKVYEINTTSIYPTYQQTSASAVKKPLWHLFDLYNNKTLKRLKSILEDECVDIIHINNYKGLSLSCFRVGHELEIPLVYESHDFSLICPRANLIRGNNTLCDKRGFVCDEYVKIQRRLLSDYVDLLISPSEFMITKFKENNFFNNTPCVKIPLGSDFKYEGNYTKTYDTIDITYIGTLGKHKGVDTLIRAFKDVAGDNLRLHIVGKGYDEEEFKQLADNDSRIIFHGFVDNKNIVNYYTMSNILVIPSICYDNSPVVIYEAFCTGTPVIGSDIGGIPELICDGDNGLLFKAGSTASLKEKLVKVTKNKELLKHLEENARQTLADDSMKLMVERIIDEYEKLLFREVDE